VEELMKECGFEKDDRPYVPHITLGRGMRFNVPFEKVRGNVHIKHECIHVHEITLFESKRVNGKLAYVPIQTAKLE
jgi:2'-5' RNA ligase